MTPNKHQAEFNRVTNRCRKRLHQITKRFQTEIARRRAKRQSQATLSEDDLARLWAEDFHQELMTGFAEGLRLGRLLNDQDGDVTDLELLMARGMADELGSFILNFADDIRNGDTISEASACARADLYARRIRGVANEAFVETGPPKAQFDWIMTAFEHCIDCPDMAALSPWNRDELWTYPGEGMTECLTNCKCVLERDDGVTSYAREDFDADEFE